MINLYFSNTQKINDMHYRIIITYMMKSIREYLWGWNNLSQFTNNCFLNVKHKDCLEICKRSIHRISNHLATTSVTLSASEHKRALQHHTGQPLPYKTSLCADTSQHLHKLCQVVDVLGQVCRTEVGRLGSRRRRKLVRCVNFAVRDGGSARRKLLQLLDTVGELNNHAMDCVGK